MYVAGVDRGDELLSFDGVTVTGPSRLEEAVQRRRPGDTVRLSIRRRGVAQELTLTVAEDPRLQLVPVERTGRQLTAAERLSETRGSARSSRSRPVLYCEAPCRRLHAQLDPHLRVRHHRRSAVAAGAVVAAKPLRGVSDARARLGSGRRVRRVARLGRRQAHQARKHHRVVLPRQSIDAVVGRRPVGDGDAAERHHARRHDGTGIQRRSSVRAVLLRAADRDDHPVRHARAVFLSRARLHGVRISRAPIRSENADVHERAVPGVARHVVRRDRGRAGRGAVGRSRVGASR